MPRSVVLAPGARPPDGRAARARCAVGYLRRSTDRQEQSIPDQRRAVEQFAEEQGLTLLRCYVDDAISGTSTVGRKGFQQLIEDAQSDAPDFAAVIAYDVKRFGRVDNDEAGYYRHILKQHGVEVLYASEGFSGDGTDDLLRPVKQWQARQESKDLAKVTIRGLLSKNGPPARNGGAGEDRGAGWWMGGAPPFGFDLRYESQTGEFLFVLRYLRDGRKQMLDRDGAPTRTLDRGETVAISRRDRAKLVLGEPERVEAVRRVFRHYVEDRRGLKAVADAMNRSGIPTARNAEWAGHYSGRWAIGTIRAILCNPAYAGDLVWNRRTDARFYRIIEGRAVERRGVVGRRLETNEESDWIVVKDAHEAIVPRRTWELARQVLRSKGPTPIPDSRGEAKRRGRPPSRAGGVSAPGKGPRERFLLSGLITCNRCGSRYEGRSRYGRKVDERGSRVRGYEYACGGYIRHGLAVCSFGSIEQGVMEQAVTEALIDHYATLGTGCARRAAVGSLLDAQIGADLTQVTRSQEGVKRRLATIDRTVRKLLDNISTANRDLVDKRLAELTAERAGLEDERESLRKLVLSHEQAEGIIKRIESELTALPLRLRCEEVTERRVVLRRCVESVRFSADTRRVVVSVFALPRIAEGPTSPPIHMLEVVLPPSGGPAGKRIRPGSHRKPNG